MKNDFSEIQQSIEKLDQEIQARKKEYVSLKILLYAGILLLLVGGLYSNSTLQKVQLESLEKSFSSFQSKSNQDINKIIKRMINFIKSKGIKKFTYDYNIEINNELTPDTWKKKII